MSLATPGRPQPPSGDGPPVVDPRLRERLRTLVCCLALITLTTATRPGRMLADTKIDMAVNPLGFLGRTLHLWDAEQFGQLQNQAAGYLFPMGPFHAIGHLIGMPPWITQRMWLSALLIAAFVGARRLAARLGVGDETTRIVAGLAYALSPHGLALLGQISSEYLPLAMAPWVLLPLVTAAEGGGRVRAAARSGLAVALCGGINATATAGALVIPVIYLLTRPRGTRRWRLLGWWSGAVAVAVAWWAVPLLLFGRYAFSFLAYTERAETTTSTTGTINVLRGAERWSNYLLAPGQVGNVLSAEAAPAVLTALLAGLGVAGLAHRRVPERTFLLLTLLGGVALITAGHAGPAAGVVRDLLDGPLAPLRNLYKFDALVRLPLALGVGHLLAACRGRVRAGRFTAAALALLAAAVPGVTNGLAAPGDFPEVPRYWRDAASWLNAHAGDQGVVAVPGSAFGEYRWGRPMDEIMQPLLTARWGLRQLVPQGSAGYSRVLEAIDQRVSAGTGSTGLSQVLGRMGVRYLLVRNDLDRTGHGSVWPARLHEALDNSPGISQVAAFGDDRVGGGWPDDATSLFDQPYPPLEVYEIAGADDIVSVSDASRVLRLRGGPEALLDLADNGVLRDRPVLLNGDAPDVGAPIVGSDALRRRQRSPGGLDQRSPTLTTSEPRDDRVLRPDPSEPSWGRDQTVAGYSGITGVSASSSVADAGAIGIFHDASALPYAALDGDPATRWETGGRHGPVGQWLRVDFVAATDPGAVTASFVQDSALGPRPARIAVETEQGRAEQDLAATGAPQRLAVPLGPTRWLRIRVLALAAPPPVPAAARVAVPELRVSGLAAGRHYRLPDTRDPAAAYVMGRDPATAPECMRGSVRWVCSPSLARRDEEGVRFDRVFSAGAAAPAEVTGSAVLTDPAAVGRRTRNASPVSIGASSTLTRHPAGLPRAAFDSDTTTTWTASADDRAPQLSLRWKGRRTISAIVIRRPEAASGPLDVRVDGTKGQWREGWPERGGRLRFAPMRTDRLTLTFRTLGTPVQVSELIVPGVAPLGIPGFLPLRSRCGDGPRILVNDRPVRTRVTGTYGDLLAGHALRFRGCGRARLAAGDNRVASAPGDPYRVDSMVVDTGGRLAAARERPPAAVRVLRWSPGERAVDVAAPRTLFLTVNENHNPGWRATMGGRTLRPIRLDGWRQGWVLPAGSSGTVHIEYRPDRFYRGALLIGLNLLLVLAIAAAWPSRRRAEPAPPRPDRRTGAAQPLVLVIAPPRLERRRRPSVVLVGAGLGFCTSGYGGLAVVAGLAARGAPGRAGPVRWRRVPAVFVAAAGLGGWVGGYGGPAVVAAPVVVAGPAARAGPVRRRRASVVFVAAAGLGGWVGGYAGLAAVAAPVLLAGLAPRTRGALAWIAAAAVPLGTAALFSGPEITAQVLGLIAVGVLAAGLCVPREDGPGDRPDAPPDGG